MIKPWISRWISRKGGRGPGSIGGLAAVVALSLSVGACSSVPDWANPVRWYEGTESLITGEEGSREARAESREAAEQSAAMQAPYPNLSTVPARPRTTSPAERRMVEGALIADREQARHAPLAGVDRNGGAVEGAPPPPRLTDVPAAGNAARAPSSNATEAANQESRASGRDQTASVAASNGSGNSSGNGAEGSRPGLPESVPQPVRARTPEIPMGPEGVEQVFRDAIAAQERPSLVLDGQGRATASFDRDSAAGDSAGDSAAADTAPEWTEPSDDGRKLATIFFNQGSSELSKEAISLLKDIEKKYDEGTIRIVGHASSRTRELDPMQHRLVNLRISLDRAEAVADRLVAFGVPANRISVVGVADNQPVYHEFMPSGEAGNRRAEIFLER